MANKNIQDRQGTSCISGVAFCSWDEFPDARGTLGVVELQRDFGFVAQRIFYIRVEDADVVRAEHAVSATQALLLLSGSVTVDLDNGRETQTLTLPGHGTGLVIAGGVWRRLRDFAPPTILLVASSRSFRETRSEPSPFFTFPADC